MNSITEDNPQEITKHARDYYEAKYGKVPADTQAFSPAHAAAYAEASIVGIQSRVPYKKHVVVIGRNRSTKLYLVYVLSGEIQMNAIVDLMDDNLDLYVPQTWIENGNSLAWLTKAECTAPDMYAEDPVEDHSFFPITKKESD